ncbi:MAG: hypothetical protein RQ751_03905 [Longimicrobiales bacterium]|nr:hypothetical protein [Longimicrobiales bacterium]
MKPPVVVLPGMTATELRDAYPTAPEPLWGLPGPKAYERVALHPDDLRYELREPAQVRPGDAFSIPYHELVRELRHDLTADADRPRPVFLFPYDWRRPLDETVDALAEFLREVAARTALLRHYHRDGYGEAPRVDLVGHSMGGLLAAGYLDRLARAKDGGGGAAPLVPVRRVVSLGTPFGGSFEAVLQIITGTAALGGSAPSSRERETARVTPALYHLLPRFPDALLRTDGALPDTLFDAALWQRGVVASIAEHMRRHGLDPAPRKGARLQAAEAFLQRMLDGAAAFRDRVDALTLPAAGLTERDWLVVAGVGEETRVRLLVEGPPEDPFFELRSLERRQGYPAREGGPPETETGDGTVPFVGALPPFLPAEAVVAVSPDDFGYWEIRDRILGRFTTLHALLPAMNRVIKLCGAFLGGEAGTRSRAPRGLKARRPPGVAEGAWDPPLRFHAGGD